MLPRSGHDAESLSRAFFVLLEHLTPVEGSVFLLHEVFGYGHAEIASVVGKSEANCRQLARRSREALVARRPRFRTDAKQERRLLDQFVHATTQGDVPGLVALLAEDVTVWADGGGKTLAARKPVIGAEKVARFFVNLAASVPAEAVRHVSSWRSYLVDGGARPILRFAIVPTCSSAAGLWHLRAKNRPE